MSGAIVRCRGDVLVLAHVVGWNRMSEPIAWDSFNRHEFRVMTSDGRCWYFTGTQADEIERILLDYFDTRFQVMT